MTYTLPIGFSAPMVRALLAGRKTQTRRLVTSMWANLKMHFEEGEECWLWVREAWAPDPCDGAPLWKESKHGSKPFSPQDEPVKWRHWRYMPRWASRISLKVTDVRSQSLHKILNEDVIAEGVPLEDSPTPFQQFRKIWDTLHTKPGTTWADNPKVIAITFEVHRGNIDALVKAAA